MQESTQLLQKIITMNKLLTLITMFFVVCVIAQQKHTVKKSETLFAISKQYQVTVNQLIKWNHLNSSELAENQVLNVSENIEPIQAHEIQQGDTPYSVSKKYNVTIEEMKSYNPTVNFESFNVGTVISLIPKKEANPNIKFHVIEPKETKFGVARKYNISIEKLEEFNPQIKESFPVGYQLYLTSYNPNPLLPSSNLSDKQEKEILVSNNVSESTPLAFDKKIDKVISFAFNQLKTPYRSGGVSSKGFDCSGLVLTSFKEINFNLPRTSRDMSFQGDRVEVGAAQKGDLIFFATNGRSHINHVGIVTEVSPAEIRFIHSSSSKGVIVSSLNEEYYAKSFRRINRVLNGISQDEGL